MGPMAARTLSLATPGGNILKETLHAQQELLQKLYSELDMERESSATAADEALSMILRLQGEKAAVGMEASQYKRIAEEKICHAQETLETFQEIIYQKEMQIASLEFQVQAYRFKLLSMGCDDLGTCELQYPDNMLSRKNGVPEESSSRSSLKRNSSLPPLSNGALSRRSSTDGIKSSTPSPHPWQEGRVEEPYIRREQDSYWEEIKKLDEQLKELDDLKGSSTFPSTEDTNDVPVTSTSPMLHPFPENTPVKSGCLESPEDVVNVQVCEDSACSTSVQDIFEVPVCSLTDQDGNSKKESHNLTFENENKNRKLDSFWDKICQSIIKETNDSEKKPLLSPDSDQRLTKMDDARERIDLEKKPLFSPSSSNESIKPKECKTDNPLLFRHPTIGVADLEFQQFNRRLKQLEDQRFVTRGHEINADKAEEELRVLREIRDKIDSMQAEIALWSNKKPLPPEGRSLGCLKEAILCFWP